MSESGTPATPTANVSETPTPQPAADPQPKEMTETPRASSGEPPQSDTSQNLSPAPEAKAPKKASKPRKSGSMAPNSISAVAASLTLEELDALPSAKRRKSLKTRGAPGPGRGWRKGLSKGQKPVYRLPDMDMSTADVQHDPDKMPVHASTPASFAGSSGSSRKSKSSASVNKSVESVPLVSATIRVLPNSADAVFKYPSMPSLKDAPPLLPLPRIPNQIPTVTPLQRSDMKPRHWQQGQREILNIAGRSWRAPAWLAEGNSPKVDIGDDDDGAEASSEVATAQPEADPESKS